MKSTPFWTQKKTQVTLWIILGILVVFVSTIGIYYVKNLNPEAEMSEEITKFQDVYTYTKAIIDQGSLHCFQLMGEQTGRIFTDQGGFTPHSAGTPPFPGIVAEVDGNSYYPQDEPHYKNALLMDDWQPRREFNFGEKYLYGFPAPLPPLDKESFDGSGVVEESIEHQLEGCIQQYLKENLKYDDFEKVGTEVLDIKEWDQEFATLDDLNAYLAEASPGFNLFSLLPEGLDTAQLQEHFPLVQVKAAEEDVQVTVILPIIVERGGNKQLLFTWNNPFPKFALRQFYTFISQDVITGDVYFLRLKDSEQGEYSVDLVNIRPQPETDGLRRYTQKITPERFVVELTEGDDGTDTVYVKDTEFEIDGKPFTFTFTRENRPPDANTIQYFTLTGNDPHVYVFWFEGLSMECPNYQVTAGSDDIYIMDPD
ncbi:hypothetical protein COY95_04465, partial [Candidatus Woesearchaeota archaeon CG_4_10_14_0_8_um_filter_47_5]